MRTIYDLIKEENIDVNDTSFDFKYQDLDSLDGIGELKNTEILYLSGNNLKNINGIEKLKNFNF